MVQTSALLESVGCKRKMENLEFLMQWSEPSCYMVWKRFILQKPCWTKSTHSRSEDWGKSSTSRLLLLTGGSQTDMFCEEHPISCPLMEIMKTTFYSAIVIMKGEPNYWDILPEPLNKTLYVKSPFNQIQWTASHMEKRGTVDQGKTGCITPKKNIYTKKNCISLTMKRPFKRMHVYSMQPTLDTFNKAGTFGYAYALLPLLTCRRSRVGQQKKNVLYCWISNWILRFGRACTTT